jgi:hypothetical protein
MRRAKCSTGRVAACGTPNHSLRSSDFFVGPHRILMGRGLSGATQPSIRDSPNINHSNSRMIADAEYERAVVEERDYIRTGYRFAMRMRGLERDESSLAHPAMGKPGPVGSIHASYPERSDSGFADDDRMAHPTRFERVTFALGGQTPTPQSRNNAFNQSQEWSVAPPTTPQPAFLLRATFPCETALWLFHDVDRRRKLKG